MLLDDDDATELGPDEEGLREWPLGAGDSLLVNGTSSLEAVGVEPERETTRDDASSELDDSRRRRPPNTPLDRPRRCSSDDDVRSPLLPVDDAADADDTLPSVVEPLPTDGALSCWCSVVAANDSRRPVASARA